MYTLHYDSPLGGILLAADEVGLTGLWFDGEKYFADTLDPEHKAQETPILREAKRWLDVYFRGQEPDFTPPLHPIGSPFRQEVWALLLQIPYGQTTTYGALAKQLAAMHGLPRMSAQAVGGAVGHNEISIIIPCHRVVGNQRQPDRLRRRHRQKGKAADAGKNPHGAPLSANQLLSYSIHQMYYIQNSVRC